MIVTSNKAYRGFIICSGATTNDLPVLNQNKEGGSYNQYMYVVDGHGYAKIGETTVRGQTGDLVDLSAYKNQEITYGASSTSAVWLAFNPLNVNHTLEVEILTTGTHTLIDESIDIILVPLTKSISIEGQVVPTTGSVRITKGKEATIVVDENAACAMVKVKPE